MLDYYDDAKYKLIEEEGYDAIPYTKELIIDLYRNGIKMAIASSSTETEIKEVTSYLDITQYFDKLVSGATVSHPKPAPDVFIKAMNELGVKSDECIIIEDSFNGVCASNAAGIPVIGFVNEHSGKQDLSKACIQIEGFDEINYRFIQDTYLRANDLPITIATTERLIIKELSLEDIPFLYQIYQNPNITKFIDHVDSNIDIEIEKHKAYIENVYHFYGYGLWGVYLKQNGRLIGRCGIQNSTINNKEEIELGYLIDANYQGNGYAYEAIKAILSYAFTELSIKRITAIIDPDNTKSLQLAERVGFEKAGEVIKNNHRCYLYCIEI
jgi:HAD superfamily hydrolase (TIGR01509 family)